MPLEKRIFGKGVDTDTELRYIQNGSVRSQKNVRSFSINGNNFCIENLKGTTLISYELPDGMNTTIGSFDDKVGQRVFFFVYNFNGNHSVLQYNYKSNVITKVVQGSALNFTEINPITSVVLIDNNTLIFTDDSQEIKKIDLDSSIVGTNITDEALVALAKTPPPAPTVQYTSNQSYQGNNLRGNLFKFACINQYTNGYRSVLGERSVVPLPPNDNLGIYNGERPVYTDNQINVTIPPRVQDDVEKILVYVSYGGDDNTLSDWYLIEEIEDTSVSNVVGFLNEKSYPILDAVEASQEQTYIPRRARCLEFVSGNRLVMANITEEFNISNVTPQVDIEPQYKATPSTSATTSITATDAATNTPISTGLTYQNTSGTIVLDDSSSTVTYDTITIGGTTSDGDIITINLALSYSINGTAQSQTIVLTYNVNASQTIEQVVDGIVDLINATDTRFGIYGGVVAIKGSSTQVRILQGINQVNLPIISATGVNTVSTVSGVAPATIAKKTFKRFSIIPFGMSYEDKYGRRTSVIELDDIYIKGHSETSNDGNVEMKFTINNDPLDGMSRYHLLMGEQQTYESQIEFSGLVQNVSVDEWKIDIPNQIAVFNTANPNSVLSYTWKRGDRIRLIGYFSTTTSVTYFSEQPALEITKSVDDGGSVKIYFNFDATSITPTFGNNDVLLCEVYTPKKTTSEISYYEIASFDIENGYHNGNTQDQTSSLPAIVDLVDVGNAYYKQRVFNATSGHTWFCEDFNFSDYYNSSVHDYGRINVVNNEEREINRPTTMVYTQPYIPETNINGLSTVFSSSLKDYDQRYGAINAISQKDNYLLFFQTDKLGYVPLYKEIGKTDSGSITIDTTELLTNPEYYNYDVGLSHTNSLAKFGNNYYGVDTKRMTVFQLAQNGITPIDDFNFNKKIFEQFNEFNQIETTTGIANIFGAIDIQNQEYLFCVNKSWRANAVARVNLTNLYIIVPTSSIIEPLSNGDSIEIEYFINGGVDMSRFTTTVDSTQVAGSNTRVNFQASIGMPTGETAALIKNNKTTLSFNFSGNYWNDEYEFDTDFLGDCGNSVVGWKQGSTYLHNSNSTRNLLYGLPKTSEIEIVFNQEPSLPKIYRNIQIESNEVWSSPQTGDIETLEGQQSLLSSNLYKKRLNQWFSAFLRDANSVNVDYPLLQGKELLTTALKVKLKNGSTSEVKLFSVSAGYIMSNLSNYNV